MDKVREALRQVKARNFIRGRGADPGVWDVSTVAFVCLEKRLRDEQGRGRIRIWIIQQKVTSHPV